MSLIAEILPQGARSLVGLNPDDPSAPPEQIPEPDAIPISGREKLAWEFEVPITEVAPAFIAFVDSISTRLDGLSCTSNTEGPGVTCTAQLPPLSVGVHIIEVAAVAEGEVVGVKSSAIRVRLDPSAEPTTSVAQRAWSVTTRDNVQLLAEIVATGLVDPTDIAVLSDSSVLIAERSGEVRFVRDGKIGLAANAPSNIAIGEGRGLLALAADPATSDMRAVFAFYTANDGGRLVRFERRDDTLVNPAVLLSALPISDQQPSAALRMSPAGYLCLALDDAGDPASAGDLGSYSGKVLRLKRDGTTPYELSSSPVSVSGVHRPAGIAWQQEPAVSWILTKGADDREELHAVPYADARTGDPPIVRYALPNQLGASDVAVYDSTVIKPFNGDLLVAAEAGQAIVRARPLRDGRMMIEWLLRNEVGPIRSVAVAPNGGIYALSGHELLHIRIANPNSP